MSETGFSAGEIRSFRNFGFAVMRQLLTAGDIKVLERELAAGWTPSIPTGRSTAPRASGRG